MHFISNVKIAATPDFHFISGKKWINRNNEIVFLVHTHPWFECLWFGFTLKCTLDDETVIILLIISDIDISLASSSFGFLRYWN